jgi:AcrR family transcriptional regulator
MATETSQDRAAVTRTVLRADAALNRERIVRAAREVFSTRGIDAPLASVARRAGVSIATLHRRFPTRDDLVAAAFAGQLDHCASVLEEAVEHPDPWRALCRLVYQICRMQGTESGFADAFLIRHPEFFDRRMAGAEEQLGALVARCQQAGRVRADVTAGDVLVLFAANAGLLARNPGAHDMSDRLVTHFLRGIGTHTDHRLRPPTDLSLHRFLGPAAR